MMNINGVEIFPEAVVWEITFACNMRCIHCGTSAGLRRPDELTLEEAINLIDELAGLGTRTITLSGGEPLMREDWRLLAERVKQNGMLLHLVTNGYMVTPEIARDMAELQFDHVGVSFDGNEATHNYIRQREDSYERALRAMDCLREAGVRFCAVSQVSNLNLGELDDMHRTLVEHGCKVWRIQMTTPTGRMRGHRDAVLSLENYPRMIDKLLELKVHGDISVDVGENIGYYGCKGTQLNDGMAYYGCYAGTRIAGVESNGDIKGCLSMPEEFVEGNIRNSSFTEIWNNPNGFAYNRQFTQETATGACRECRYLPLCRGGCATTSFSQSGCRAENAYCIYQMEQAQGVRPVDPPEAADLLARFQAEATEAGKAE
jgi:radical SAM protein with 4Fe4S-binding SPASM domain